MLYSKDFFPENFQNLNGTIAKFTPWLLDEILQKKNNALKVHCKNRKQF